MNKVFGLGKENLKYVNRLKRRIFYCVISLVIILNIFISAGLNLRKLSEIHLGKAFFVVDLQYNLENSKKEELEKMFWKMEGVRKVQYLSKEKSFQDLQQELNISIPMKDNPLTDSIVVYLTKTSDVEKIRETLEDNESVKEVFQDKGYLEHIQKNNGMYQTLTYVSALGAVLIFGLLIFLFKAVSALDFFNCINVIPEDRYNLKRAKRRNLIPFTLSTFVGELIFLNIYVYVRKIFIAYKSDFLLLSYWDTFLWHFLALFIINLVIWILPITILGIDGEEE
ncbi:permease-like cell division protein FtsX [Fusobacterium necrophorum]|uniref:permease-like cell division protein FtsX n=1 Tax=Fusobacterium necrophorum TaxID=859 RepID=UPI003FA164BD